MLEGGRRLRGFEMGFALGLCWDFRVAARGKITYSACHGRACGVMCI